MVNKIYQKYAFDNEIELNWFIKRKGIIFLTLVDTFN